MEKFKKIILAVAVSAIMPHITNAQRSNANLKNEKTMEKVSFQNKIGITVVGNVHYPVGFDRNKKYAALVVVPPAGGAKEQTAGLYAKKMSENGFVAIAIDGSYQGESGGEPRYKEDPIARVEDIRAAVDYLTTMPYIDENRIGALGICAGGGYVVSAAMTERRIKAVASVVPVNGGRENRAQGSEATIATLETIAKQRTAEARGEAPMILAWIPDEYKVADDIDLRESYEYYRTSRGANPNWQNKMRFTSLDAVMAYDAFYLVESLLTQPLKIIIGSKPGAFGSIIDGNDLYKRAASKHKDIVVMEGASHFDLYDNANYVDKTVEAVKSFFDTNLK
ncbi:alpha/beta hydrolase [Pedobacter panaciterrae]|uniref:Alpha/beta hydrolase n=1 Tax=Pedobacter panaciterrae TaxID=363849 RepID=A0ABU8NHI1_9SPHI